MYHKSLVKKLFSEKIEQLPTRNGYGDGVIDAGKHRDEVMVLCCDLTESTRSEAFKKMFPDRFLEMGVAEQNMMGVAAGLALEGKIPFCASYAVFSPGRNWDQLRVSVCYNNANVKIVGAHAGISVGPDGATHQALEDLAITRVLPRLTVISPCDYYEARKATLAAAMWDGPVYLRFAREKTPVFTTPHTPFAIGKAQILKSGRNVSIVGTGPLLYEALSAAHELQNSGIDAEVVNVSTLKPLDEETIIASVKKTQCVVTVEEHQVIGGLAGAVSELLGRKFPAPIEFVGMHDSFGESGQTGELIAKYGMGRRDIVLAAKRVIKRV